METVKEKLVKLLKNIRINCTEGVCNCDECEFRFAGSGSCCENLIADYLVKHGVTIRECGMDCKNCWKTKLVNPVQEWVSVEERLPEKSEYLGFGFDGREFYKRLEIAYKTDTIEYDIGYYDGFKWFNERNHIVKNVVGWRVLKNFPQPPKGVQ